MSILVDRNKIRQYKNFLKNFAITIALISLST